MPNLHPLLVHFPIALIFVVLACDIIGVLLKRKSFFQVGTILSVFTLLGAAAAVTTGLMAEDSVWHTQAAHEIFEDHETAALIFLGFITLYTAFRLIFHKRLSEGFGRLSLVLALIACGIVAYVGYLGGEMVFRHGTGVKAAEIETARADSLARILETYRQNMDTQMKEMDKQMQDLARPESNEQEHHH